MSCGDTERRVPIPGWHAPPILFQRVFVPSSSHGTTFCARRQSFFHVSEGSSLAKHARKLRGSHRGHRGNIKVLHIRPAPNFTVSLKIDLCDLCDLRVINSPIASATEPTSSS